jgi:hypothetical protein
MKVILNDIRYVSLKDIKFYKDRIFYEINDIRVNGLFFKIKKNMILTDNKYIVNLNPDILSLNYYFSKKYKSFLRDDCNPYIEVIKNEKTDIIFDDKHEYIVLNFMSINDNNYPKIHILPWT